MSELEPCENCGRNIGKLEKPYVWKESVVCAECFQRLKQTDATDQTEPEEMSIPAAEFEKPLPPAVKVSTWSPMKAALLERAQHDRSMGSKRSGWRAVLYLGFILTASALIGLGLTNERFHSLMLALLFVGVALLWIVVAFLPMIVAQERKHPNISGVQAITILGFLIPVLWLVAIVWAYSAPNPDE